jgi:hypothetical protein
MRAEVREAVCNNRNSPSSLTALTSIYVALHHTPETMRNQSISRGAAETPLGEQAGAFY